MHRKTRSKGRKTNRKQKGGGIWNSFKETIKRGVSKIFSSKDTSTTGIAPVVPKPVVAPAPVAPAPVTPAPVAPAPVAPAPVAPAPIAPPKQNNYGIAANNGRRRNNYGMGAVAPVPVARVNNYGMGAVAPAPHVNNYRMGQNYNRRRNMNRMYAPGAPQQQYY